MDKPTQNGPAFPAEPKPSRLMRSWHPDLFPDTELVRATALPKDFLEYHLETLTARKQEQQFEEFCRRLLEREVCPNLKPQTGPTGGGDSKMDASTYPVAPVLAARYYWGRPDPPAPDLWAFAFSCKKKWKDKVKEDAKKLSALTPKPKVAYFVTNQFVRDKDRAALEGGLSKQYGYEAHILDRTWIVKCVLERGHDRIAVASLNIQFVAPAEERVGPRDARRRQELEAVEARCRDLETYDGNDYALAQDYLEAARLARGLGRPRSEVDGLFERSRRIARRTGVADLVVRTAYHQAWTAFWWYDDPGTLAAVYGEIEQYLPSLHDADGCGLFLNLWTLLFSVVRQGDTTAATVRLDERREALLREFERQAADGHRPVNALSARTDHLVLRLFGSEADAAEVGRILDGLTDCLDRSRAVGAYPALDVINRLKVFQQHLGGHPRFGPLFEKMRSVVRGRGGDTSEGELLLQRGGQLLGEEKYPEALNALGQARSRLFKDETMSGAVRASLACSHAYFSMGLYWAARMESMITAHVALKREAGKLFRPREGFWAVSTLARLDLYLGRLPAFLGWYDFAQVVCRHEATRGRGVSGLERELAMLELLLAVRILAADAASVAPFEAVLGHLSRATLDMPRWALLHRLGRTAEAFADFPRELADTPEAMTAYFESLMQSSDCIGLPPPADPASPFVRMSTRLLGVDYRIKARSDYGVVLMAENILAVLEAALASARWENLAFVGDRFDLTLDVADGGRNPPEIRFERPHGRDGYRLEFAPGLLEWMNRGGRSAAADFLKEFLFAVLLTTTIDPYEDLKAEFEAWDGEDVFTRALSLSPLSVLADDLIGRKGYGLEHWRGAADAPAV